MPPPPTPLPSKGQDQTKVGKSDESLSRGTKRVFEDEEVPTSISAPLSHIAPVLMDSQSGDATTKRPKWNVSELFPEFKTGKVQRPA